ncbi:helix-turn-helix transcriptional regulator [Chloroflexota bacterium]
MRTRIKEYRARHGLSHEKPAEMVGVRRETITFLEQGNYNPSLRLAYHVTPAVQATIDEVFIFNDD